MGKIFCLLGKSGAGKDTVFRALMEKGGLGLKGVVTYTTRPRRDGEAEGVEYHFITERRLGELKSAGKIIEMRRYDTVRGPWYYCTVDDGGIDLASGSYLMIVTLEAFRSLTVYFGRGAVVPLYIEVDDGVRLQRALDRENTRARPEYREMCRRFLADEADFAPEKLKAASIEKRYLNDDLGRCVAEIRSDILGQGAS